MLGQQAQGVDDYIYLQPVEAGEANRFLVRRRDFDVPTAERSWFRLHLVTYPVPSYATAVDGRPVYATACPHAVLRELLACVMEPARYERYKIVLPPALTGIIDLFTWNHYTARFLDITDPPDAGPAKKKQCVRPGWFPTAARAASTSIDRCLPVEDAENSDYIFACLYATMERTLSREERRCVVWLQHKRADGIVASLREIGYTVTEDGKKDARDALFHVKW